MANDLSSKLRQLPEFGVEVDALPGGFVCSASFKAKLDKERVRSVTLGERKISTLFSSGQRKFFATHAPADVDLDQLVALGPLTALKLKHTPKDFARPLVVELWLYPDGSRILELSLKCRPAEALAVAAEAETYLTDRGVDFSAEQSTKTTTALKFFAGELT